MTTDFISLLGNYGAMGLVFVFFIYSYFKERNIADTLKESNKEKKADVDEVARKLNSEQEVSISNLKILLEMHIEGNEKSFGVIHNGLNTYNQTLKDMDVTLQNYRIMVEKLATILEERLPKKE